MTANPATLETTNFTAPGGVQTAQAQVQQVTSSYQARNTFSKDGDVQGEDIVVIGQRLKNVMTAMYLPFGMGGGYTFTLPCIGTTQRAEVRSILWNMRFNVTNTNFGPGRGGENRVSASDSSVVININKDTLRGYDALAGGLDFLVAHEIAHALKSMQEYDQARWNSYIAGPGLNLSDAERRAQYPSSSEFQQNEARANSVARGLASYLTRPPLQVTPTNGYQAC